MPIRPPEYERVVTALTPVLANLPGRLVAIDGRDGSGKTTLGRFLAWHFNVSLVETDLFLHEGKGLVYLTSDIERIIARRLAIPRPVIVEGVTVLRLLSTLGRKPDFLVYVRNPSSTGSDSLTEDFRTYEQSFDPLAHANVLVEVAH